MKNLISVIILEKNNRNYLVRCVNSIKRQTYDNIEIIIVSDTDMNQNIERDKVSGVFSDIREALESAKGKYVYFCSETSVLEKSVIQKLYDYHNDNTLYYVKCYIYQGKSMYKVSGMEMLLQGKLLEKDKINSVLAGIEGDRLSEILILGGYLEKFQKLEETSDVYIYDIKEENLKLDNNELWGFPEWNNVVQIYKKISDPMRQFLVEKVISLTKEMEAEPNVSFLLADKLHDEYELNFEYSKGLIGKWINDVAERRNIESFENLKEYFALYQEDKDFLEILLKYCSMTEKQYTYMMGHDLNAYLFLVSQIPEEEKIGISPEEIEHLNIKINQLSSQYEKRIMKIESYLKELSENVINSESVEEKIQEDLSGPALAEFTVEKYEQGNLGFKTIIKSLIAWIKHKF